MADDKSAEDQSTPTDDIYDEGTFEDDGTAAMLREMLDNEDGDEEEDTGGLDQPIEEPSTENVETVTTEEGRELISDSELGKKKEPKDEAAAKPKAEEAAEGADAEDQGKKDDPNDKPDAKAEEGDKGATDGEDNADGGDEAAPDLTKAEVGTLLEGLEDGQKAEVTRRLKEADTALAPFNTPYAQEQMAQFGASPAQVAGRLVELAEFASKNPAEYLAWVVKESAAEGKVEDLLTEAAKLHGYKVVKADADSEDDDLFDDPEKADLKREIAELKGKLNGGQPEFGPDTPERTQVRDAQQQLHSFINEKDEAGQLKRPLFPHIQHQIAQKAQALQTSTGKAVTIADMQRLYDEAATEMRAAFGAPSDPTPTPGAGDTDSAAQNAEAVKKEIEKKAAEAEKAQRASKSLDGTGQGASRRPPSIPADTPLDKAINQIWDDLEQAG